MEEFLNNVRTRIVIGIFIGIPATLATILASIYGLTFGLAGLAEGNAYMLSMGLVNIAAIIGIFGAWKRLYKSSNKMSEDEKQTTRVMLIAGFLSSLSIALFLLTTTERIYSLFFIALSIGAALFIYATPKNSNK